MSTMSDALGLDLLRLIDKAIEETVHEKDKTEDCDVKNYLSGWADGLKEARAIVLRRT